MATSRTGKTKWLNERASMIRRAKARGELQCFHCNKALDPNAPANTANAIEIDHLIPVAQGGTDDIGNRVLSCHRCNRSKGARRTPATAATPTAARHSREWFVGPGFYRINADRPHEPYSKASDLIGRMCHGATHVYIGPDRQEATPPRP